MKTLRFLGMAIMAVLMCVNFASCSNEEVVPDEEVQDKYITVGLDCVGEYLDVRDSPLTRAVGDDVYYIQVYSNGVPYANGTFGNSLEGVTINLLQGAKYKFKVAIGISRWDNLQTGFTYSTDNILFSFIAENIGTSEGFYGELDDYTPEEGGDAEIETKRVSYAAKFIAENLTEGTLKIDVANMNIIKKQRYSVSLTPENTTSDEIYSFYNIYDAWKGIYTQTGTDSETGESIYEYIDYTSEKTLTITWAKDDGTEIPFGSYKVTFKRNVRTTIRIDVANIPSVSNGITVTKEETAITDDENEYEISGGEIVEVPVNSES